MLITMKFCFILWILCVYLNVQVESDCSSLPLPQNVNTIWPCTNGTDGTKLVSHTSSYLSTLSSLVFIGGYSVQTGQPVTSNTVMIFDPMAMQYSYPTLTINSAISSIMSNAQFYLPGSRSEHTTVVWRDALYVYGGQNMDFLQDMWRLCLTGNGALGVWDQVLNNSLSTFPSSRKAHSMVMAFQNDTAMISVVFGGILTTYDVTNEALFSIVTATQSCVCCTSVSAVLWQKVNISNSTTAPPPPRAYHSSVMITVTVNITLQYQCMALYGGQDLLNNIIYNDLWLLCPVFTNTSVVPFEQIVFKWTKVQQVGNLPLGRFGHAAISSALATGRFIIFGGSNRFPNDYLNDIWEYNHNVMAWAMVNISQIIPTRTFHTIAYINATNFVIYGGKNRYYIQNATPYSCQFMSPQCVASNFMTFCTASNQSVCQQCDAGYYVPTNALTCQPCPAGTFSSFGSAVCTPCAAGTYGFVQGAQNASSCIACPIGMFSATIGANAFSFCLPCTAGTYSTVSGSSSCTACNAGTYSNVNSSTCSNCPTGTFSGAGYAVCANCTDGFYSPLIASTRCYACPLGMYSNLSASSCAACPIGTYGSRLSASFTDCVPCAMGTYGYTTGQTGSCASCPVGTYINATGRTNSSSCMNCTLGTFAANTGTVQCSTCGLNTFANQTGTSTCRTCPSTQITLQTGSVSSAQCQFCDVGFYYNTNTQGCQSCPPGTHSLATTVGCVSCLPGQYSSTVQEAQGLACIECPPMTYSNTSGATLCLPCASTSYSSNGWSSCISCNSTTTLTTASCPVGKNGQICSNVGRCVLGGCQCTAGYYGVTCSQVNFALLTLPGQTSTTTVCNTTFTPPQCSNGVLYFGTANNTVYVDNTTSKLLVIRDSGYQGAISAKVVVTNAQNTILYTSTVQLLDRVMALNVTVPTNTATFRSSGCIMLYAQLQNVIAISNTIVSNVSNLYSSVVVQLQASRYGASLLQVQMVESGVYVADILGDSAVSTSLIVSLDRSVLTSNRIYSIYWYFDSSLFLFNMSTMIPAMLAKLQESYGSGLKFGTNVNLNGSVVNNNANTFSAAIAGYLTRQQIPTSTPLNVSFLSNSTLWSSIQWLKSDRHILIVSTANTINTTTANITAIQTLLAVQNAGLMFIVPDNLVTTYQSFVQSIGQGTSVLGYNLWSYYQVPVTLLQTLDQNMMALVSNDTKRYINSVSVVNSAPVTVTFSLRPTYLNDTFSTNASIVILGLVQITLRITTSKSFCTILPSSLPIDFSTNSNQLLNGWVKQFTTIQELSSVFNSTNPSIIITGVDYTKLPSPIDLPTQLFMISNYTFQRNTSNYFIQNLSIVLEAGTTVLVRGYTYNTFQANCSIIFQYFDRSNPTTVLNTTISSKYNGTQWEYLLTTTTLPFAISQAKLLLTCFNTSSPIVPSNSSTVILYGNIGLITDPSNSCSCGNGYYYTPQSNANTVCSRCPAGFTCAGGFKLPCPRATYSFGHASTCLPCRTGWICDQGLTVPCPEGMFTIDASTCQPCMAGSYCHRGVKQICGVGTYSQGNAYKCELCIPGTMSNTTGATNCTKCPSGYTSNYKRNHCLPCNAGEVSSAGQQPCQSCIPGTYSRQGSATCTNCQPGQYADTNASSKCLRCPFNTFSNTTGSTTCTTCPENTYTQQFGSTRMDFCIEN